MSLINEALKKAHLEGSVHRPRHAGLAPPYATSHVPAREVAGGRRLATVLGWVAVGILAGAALLYVAGGTVAPATSATAADAPASQARPADPRGGEARPAELSSESAGRVRAAAAAQREPAVQPAAEPASSRPAATVAAGTAADPPARPEAREAAPPAEPQAADAGGRGAGQADEPTRHAVPDRPSSRPAVALALTGVSWSERHAFAIVNGKLTRVGDEVAGHTVVRIGPREVELRDAEGRSVVLQM